MSTAVLDRSFFRDLFRQKEADEFLIQHPKTGMLMILVPAGKFLTDTGHGAPFEVELPAYYLAAHPVTNAQYARFVAEAGHAPPKKSWGSSSVWKNGIFPPNKADHPVVAVSWEDATAYCQWAGLRLPTELEWEKAARGKDGRAYPWGQEWDSNRCRNKKNKGNETTASVWSYGHGGAPFGGLQLTGNVWEWCADWYRYNAYYRYWQGDLAVPSSGELRVVRGRSWKCDCDPGEPYLVQAKGDPWVNRTPDRWECRPADDFSVSHRGMRMSGNRDDCGFRCVAELDASP